ncbi:MAG TPA: ABC transporter permease subunit [Streptosporangiaceae bacterium]|jgi:NitT/TauT family transport system permease protein
MAADQATDKALYGLDHLEIGLSATESRSSRLARKAWAASWPKVLAIILVLVVWELVHLSGWKHLVLKGPSTVLSNLSNMVQHAVLWDAIGVTMRRAVIGYLLALIIGAIVGLLVARIPPLRAALGSIITGLQTMPSIAWYPFAIILFSGGTSAILFVMVMGAAPSIANGLITGVDYTPPLLLRAGRTMGLRGLALYRYLILPASLPAFVAGLKQGWAFAWRSLMAGELVVSIIGPPGLGVLLNTDQSQLDFTGATTIIITILIVGIVVDMIFTKADLALRRRRGLLDPAAAS